MIYFKISLQFFCRFGRISHITIYICTTVSLVLSYLTKYSNVKLYSSFQMTVKMVSPRSDVFTLENIYRANCHIMKT